MFSKFLLPFLQCYNAFLFPLAIKFLPAMLFKEAYIPPRKEANNEESLSPQFQSWKRNEMLRRAAASPRFYKAPALLQKNKAPLELCP